MNEHPDKRHALIERIEKKGLQVFGANAVSHEDEKIVLEALKAFTPSHAPRIGDECADLKAELQRKYPDPLPKDRRLLYYMEAAEAWGQLARDLEDRLERCAEAYGEAHGRAAEMAESIRAESAPSTTGTITPQEALDRQHAVGYRDGFEAASAASATPRSVERVKCDYPRCGKAESRCGVCDYSDHGEANGKA